MAKKYEGFGSTAAIGNQITKYPKTKGKNMKKM